MTEEEIAQYQGRKIRLPQLAPDRIGAPAGTIGTLAYAGWEDWFCVYIDGVYYVRERLSVLKPHLVED